MKNTFISKFCKQLLFIGLMLTFGFSLGQTKRVLANWMGGNASSITFPYNGDYSNPLTTGCSMNLSGVTPLNDNRFFFQANAAAATLDIATHPYISFTINAGSNSIDLDRLVFQSYAGYSVSNSLRYSVDGYASHLGSITHNSGNYTLTSVNLNSLPNITGTVEFRLYFYGNSSTTSVYLGSTGSAYSSVDSTPSSYGPTAVAPPTGYSWSSVSFWYNYFAPAITTNSSLTTFSKCTGLASNAQTFSVSGTNLTSNITIAALTGYEYSLDGITYTPTLSITPTGGTVTNVPVYVRLTSASTGSPVGNILISSTGATSQTIAVTGTVNALPSATIGGINYVGQSATSFIIPYTATTNSPTLYSVSAGTNALSGFTPIVDASLSGTSGSLTIPIPSNSAFGTYDFVLKVKNATTLCESTPINLSLKISSPPPTITSFSPLSGEVGSTITITGTGFDVVPANNIVYFGSTKAVVSSSTSTQLVVTVPNGGTFSPISVTTNSFTVKTNKPFKITNSIISGLAASSSANFPLKSTLTSISGSLGASNVIIGSGDFNNDGWPDLVKGGTSAINVYKNLLTSSATLSNTSFGAAQSFATTGQIQALIVEDINADGKLDVIVSGDNGIDYLINTTVGATISFAPKVNISSASTAIRLYDFNKDGLQDIVSVNGTTVSIFPSISSSQNSVVFGTAVNVTLSQSHSGLDIADFNDDGLMDIISSSGTVAVSTILINTSSNGSISFTSFTLPVGHKYVKADDMDGDNKPDIVIYNTFYKNNFSAGGNSISASDFTSNTISSVNEGDSGYSSADLNGDGFPEIFIGTSWDKVHWLSNSGTGIASSLFNGYPFVANGTGIGVDLNADAKVDIVSSMRNTAGIQVYQNILSPPPAINKSGTFTTFIKCSGLPSSAQTFTISGSFLTANVVVAAYTNLEYSLDGVTYASTLSLAPTSGTLANTTIYVRMTSGSTSLTAGNISLTSTGATTQTLAVTGTVNPLPTITLGTVAALVPSATSFSIPYTAVTNAPTVYSVSAGSNILANFVPVIDAVFSGATGNLPVNIPANSAPGTYVFNVKVKIGSTSCESIVYNVSVTILQPAPTITSFLPTTATVGTQVIITGTGFSTTPANNVVFFGPTRAVVSAATTTSLTVTVPSGAAQSNLVVLNSDNSLIGMSNDFFTPTYLPSRPNITATDYAPSVNLNGIPAATIIAEGDLDGDGKPDLAVAYNTSQNKITVYRNTSTTGLIDANSFAPGVDIVVGSYPGSLSIADLDGDGKLDIVVCNGNSNNISILKNNSTIGSITSSSFATHVVFAAGLAPLNAIIKDIDRDGKVDIAVVNKNSNTLSILKNNISNGTINLNSFAPKVDFVTGTAPFSIAIGDINGDNKLDLVTTNSGSNSISIFENTTTDGIINSSSFAPKVDISTGTTPQILILDDLDDDNKLDIAVTNKASNTISIYKNNGVTGAISTNNFANKVDFVTASQPYSITSGDINGDGKVDIAITNINGRVVSLYKNKGVQGEINSNLFEPKVDFPTSADSNCVLISDLDQDTKPEIIFTNYNNIGTQNISILKFNNFEVLGTLTPFTACLGSPSVAQTLTIQGTNLSANIVVAALTGYEYSLDGINYSSTVTIVPVSGSVAATTLYVRLTGATAGTPSGTISISCTGTTTQTKTAAGTVSSIAAPTLVSTPTVQSFTTVGDTTWTAPAGVGSVEYLVVGGGGGGANGYDNAGGGGGGAGMVLTGRLAVTSGNVYPITIGDGGNGGANSRTNNWGAIGQNSIFGTLTALGGGGGKGSRTVAVAGVAQNSNCTAGTGAGGSGGGSGGKGGGGAGGAGNNNSASTGGAGGAGKSSSITGTAVTYGAGGAGGSNATSATGANGTSNRGNGGNAGTGGTSSSAAGGKGGSGIVVIKYVTQANAISYCQGETAVPLQATALAGSTLQWYTVATGGTPSTTAPTPDTTVPGTTTYYVSQKDNTSGCESSRISITVTINELPSAPITTNAVVNYCQGDVASPLAATSTLGSTLQWYQGSTLLNSCAPLPSTAAIGTTTYYVSQISAAGCEGAKTTITVNVYAVPSAPTASNVTLCANTTASPLTADATSGHTLQWYTVATGGTASTTAPTPSTSISGITTYYVSQKNDITNCESARTAITVTIPSTPYPYDRAVNFSAGGHLTKAASTSINLSDWTVEAWIYPTAWNSLAGIVSKRDFQFTTNTNGALSVMIERDWSWELTTTTSNVVTLNQWQHVAASYNASTKVVKIYVNGALVHTFTRSQSFVPDFNSYDFKVGYNNGIGNGTPNRTFAGNIDEVKVWNAVRTDSEITSNYTLQLVGNESGLVAYYKFDQGVGSGNNTAITSLIDLTANANHLTPASSTPVFAMTGATNNIVQVGPTILSSLNICLNGTSTLTHTVSGGTWSSADSTIISVDSSSGLATANAQGTVNITYAFTFNGCNYSTTKLFTVNPLPAAPVATTTVDLCQGITATALTATATSGNTLQWYTVATAGSASTTAPTPVTTTVGQTIYYVSQKNNTTGCEGSRTAITVNVNAIPTISGVQSMTVGGSTLQLTGSGTPHSTTPWASSNPAAATISTSGVVTPVGGGSTTITYTTAEGCSITATINVVDCNQPFGNALAFGVGTTAANADYVQINSRIFPSQSVANFTIETWIKPAASDIMTGTPGTSWLSFLGYTGTKRSPSLYITNNGVLHASWTEGAAFNGSAVSASSPTTFIANKWTHVALVKDGTTMRVYVDGNQLTSLTCLANLDLPDNAYWLGKSDQQFSGALDEVRFWSTARTQSQIQSTMNTELVGNETGLLAYFDFNQGVAGGTNTAITTLINKANNTINGTLTNFTKTGTVSNFVGSTNSTFSISGSAAICANSTAQYTHQIPGGTWTLSNGANATVSATGLVTSAANETVTLSYAYTLNGCAKTDTKTITIDTPASPTATTTVNLCQGIATTALSATATTGNTLQWYTVATGGTASTTAPTPSTGTVGSTIYYVSQKNNTTNCESTRTAIAVTVNPIPTIIGIQNMTVGGTTLQLTGSGTPDATTPWVSSNTAVATISASGEVTAVAGGTTNITYTTNSGCTKTALLNVIDCTAPFGNALNFDGVDDYAVLDNVGSNSALQFANTTNYTLEAWVNRSTPTSTNGVIISKQNGGVAGNYSLGISAAGIPFVSREASPWAVSATTSIPPNEWTHIAGVFDGASLKIYINGVLNNSVSTSGSISASSVTAIKVALGCMYNNNVPSNFFKGSIDEVRIWNIARTASQIQQASRTTLQGNEAGLVAYYDFNQGLPGGNNTVIISVVNTVNSSSNGVLTNFAKTGTTSNFVNSISTLDIAGASAVCANSTSQFTHPISGGTWSVSSGAASTVSASGLLSTAGGENITLSYNYTLNGCSFTATKTVEVQQPVISGTTSIGAGESITLTATTTPASSNAWVSSNPAVATVTPNGVVNGLTLGTTTITFTNNNGCTATQIITVTAGTTLTPVLTSPVSNTTGATTLNFNYSLPETPLAGSVRLTFTPVGGGTPIIWTMTNATSAVFSYVVGTNPTAVSNVVSGTALGFTTYNVTLAYQDAFSNPAASVTNTNVQTLAPPSISFASTTYNEVINVAVSIPTINTGGAMETYSIAPALPAGLSLNTTTGLISGTPTTALVATNFTVTATNAAGSDSETFSLFIDIDTDGDGDGDTTDPDIDGDGIPNGSDVDPDGDGTNDNGTDTDGDGINDANDPDIDGDGIPNGSDVDPDGDGINDNGTDTDGDGVNDANDPDIDGDGIPNGSDSDANGDGIVDNGPDTDGDGINDANDPDIDGDGIPNGSDSDANGDGIIDNGPDTDGDGINDANDPDIDGDGIPNGADADANGDGTIDNGATDTDGDGIVDGADSDVNGDGVIDNGPDTDGDGINDANDPDIDGDGIPNGADADPDGDGTINNGPDTDGDGINDANDPDIDGDGVPNGADADPDGNGTINNGPDTDGDGINDANDPDIDGDGIPNGADADPDGDGTINNGPDTDGDGINDAADADPDGNGTIDNGPDTDGDGINDANDPDIDGDGIPNAADVDPDGNGTNNNGTDMDGDGINDANDPDMDGDGIPNGVDNCPNIVNPSVITQPSSQAVNICPNGTPPTLTIQANGQQLEYQWYVNTINSNVGGTPITGATSTSFVPSNALVGPHYYYVVVNGTCGMSKSEVSGAITVQDITLPTVVTQNISVALNASGTATITAAQINNGSTDNCSIASVTVSPSSFTCANIGTNTVTLTVTDGNGNVNTGTATVTVTESTLPTVVTQNISVALNASGTATIATAQINNGSTDNCSIASMTVSPSSFTCTNIGTNIVTLTVTDGNGNINTGTATVTVTDTILPTVVTQNASVTLNAQGTATVTATQVNNGSFDNCSIATITVSPSSFTCANIGTNTVTVTVTDASGNVSSSTAIVTVVLDNSISANNDLDAIPDNCDDDDDNDGILDVNDNCQFIANQDQLNTDNDTMGDICDPDDDNDGIDDVYDNCPKSYNPYQEDRDNDGQGDSCDTIEINVSDAISPNGDGINDTWVIYNIENHPNAVVKVFNRWGKEVFKARHYQNNWGGEFGTNTETLPEGGSYYYQIDLDGDGSIDKDGWLYISRK